MDGDDRIRGEQGIPGGGPPPAMDSSGRRVDEPECQPNDWRARCRSVVKTVGWGKVIAAAVISALLVLIIVPAIFGQNPYDFLRGKSKVTTVISPSGGSADVTTVAKNVTPSIVNIDVRLNPQNPTTTATPTIGSGSGVIYKENGYIITNNHLVGTATSINVTLGNGKKYTGTRVGTDPSTDIAVVKIDATGLPPIKLGNSDSVVVGQLVVAVGSPLGFQQTVTSGIISALHRGVQMQTDTGQTIQLDGLIQTDAPINPGNSGGALTDSSSRLIGINAVIATQTGGSSGIAFAIPSNTAVSVANKIIGG
jgi:S1-C subfamily serine protease